MRRFTVTIPLTAIILIAILLTTLISLPTIVSEANESTTRAIEMHLKKFGPASADSLERRNALLEIDELFMNDSLDTLKVLLNEFMSTALWEVSSSSETRPSIWYFWNMGFILRTRNHIIGFDLPEVLLDPLNEEQKRILAESLDIFFVSHVDIPHVDRDIVSMMRPDSYVVCPEEVVDFFDKNRLLDRECTVVTMKINETCTVDSVSVKAYFGDDRRGSPMRCYLVTSDGVRVLHTADQHYVSDWMREMAGKHIDVLMIDPLEQYSWVVEAINVIKPAYALPGTMYDMSHPKNTWDGYPYAYRLRDEAEPEVIPMFFGEKFQIRTTSGASLPVDIIMAIVVLAAVGVIGVVVLSKRKGPREGKERRTESRGPACEKRYVEKLCLTCKYYVIKGGHPYCTKYNIKLDAELPGSE